ncbi:hypothetical protein NXS19_009069 [Fusarium pseudograminearum]|nr:hypothetical protein NXS19_009069 [Fusarium pseudograminearum]
MTPPVNQQNSTPANNTPATTTSYASAAGAPKKSAQAPVVATGSHPPAVVGDTASSQNAKDASSTPVNGKPTVTPAVPRSSANLNGFDHSRKSSVTMAANAPNNFVANGGPVGGAKSNIQFGFDSPGMANSTPQSTSAAYSYSWWRKRPSPFARSLTFAYPPTLCQRWPTSFRSSAGKRNHDIR